MLKKLLFVLFAACCAAMPAPPEGSGLLLISIDGLNPDYVISAERYGLKIPTLRRLLREGAHATAVKGVLPTVTYPTHTTMLTGVWPAKHGVYLNTTFDPKKINSGGWYWYAEDIRVPTLWESAEKAGYVVGSISWPVSVSAKGVRYLIPEYWRAMRSADDVKLMRALATPGLLSELEAIHGKYIVDLDVAVPGDWMRTRYAESIIRRKGARFFTLHIASLDHIEHETGPASAQGFAALEEIDKMVAVLEEAIRSIAPKAAVCVVSDHGMSRVEHEVSLAPALAKAGVKAQVWSAGGSAAIMLNEGEAAGPVDAVLRKLASDPANGIARVLDKAEIAKLGGAPTAAFWVDLKPGYATGSAVDGPVVKPVKVRGTHGYSPEHAVMRAAFMIAGPRIRRGVNVGEIDLRSLAPTLAKQLGVALQDAELKALDIFIQ